MQWLPVFADLVSHEGIIIKLAQNHTLPFYEPTFTTIFDRKETDLRRFSGITIWYHWQILMLQNTQLRHWISGSNFFKCRERILKFKTFALKVAKFSTTSDNIRLWKNYTEVTRGRNQRHMINFDTGGATVMHREYDAWAI